jgi:rare lipoprotein A
MKNIFSFYKVLLYASIFLLYAPTSFSQDTMAVKDVEMVVDSTSTSNKTDTAALKPTQKTLTGTASYYAAKFEGRKTANGEIFSHKKMTAACNKLPLGTWIEVTNLRNNKKVIVKTNDRLHPSMSRVVDLTMAAAKKLDFVAAGLTKVKVVVLGKNYKKK